MGEPKGKGIFGRPRRRWCLNIKMDTKEFYWECVYWIDLAHDLGKVGGHYEPLGSIKFGGTS